MSNLKEKLSEYLPMLKQRMKEEPDKDKRRSLKIKHDELKKLKDEL